MTLTALILAFIAALLAIHREHWPDERKRKGAL